jgi:hypothetical protein
MLQRFHIIVDMGLMRPLDQHSGNDENTIQHATAKPSICLLFLQHSREKAYEILEVQKMHYNSDHLNLRVKIILLSSISSTKIADLQFGPPITAVRTKRDASGY